MRLAAYGAGILLVWACGNATLDPVPDDAGTTAGQDAGHTPAPDAQGSTPDADTLDDAGGEPDATPDAARDAEVAADRAILYVHYPSSSLQLRGAAAGLSWQADTTMTATGNTGEFRYVAQLEGPDATLEWKPREGGRWSKGPNYRVRAGQIVHVYPRFEHEAGEVRTFRANYTSPRLPASRPIYVYLPPTARENTLARFPVVYMHDGQNLFDPALSFAGVAWEVDRALDHGAADGSIAEAIVVGIGNSPDRGDELTAVRDEVRGFGGNGAAYLGMLTEEIKPLVDQSLPTLPERQHTFVAGSSLGGFMSLYAGLERADVFGGVGAFSPTTYWSNRWIVGQVQAMPAAPQRPRRVYLDSGDSGPSQDDAANTADLAAVFEGLGYQRGVDFDYVLGQGDVHDEAAWQRRLPRALAFLLGPGR